MAKLPTPIVVVLLEAPGTEELTEYTVQTDNRDWVAWDLTRSRKNWPTTEEAPMVWLNFMAHHALCKRSNIIDMTFEEFSGQRAVKCFPVDSEGQEITVEEAAAGAVSADPFLQEAVPTS